MKRFKYHPGLCPIHARFPWNAGNRYHFRSRWEPHQSTREKARRIAQMEKSNA